MRKKYFIAALLLFFVFLFSVQSLALNDSSVLYDYVTDNAYVFSPETRNSLNDALKELETETNGVQLVVFTEDYIPNGMTLEERTLMIAAANGVGKEGNDNGVLFYLAVEDRAYRWEVGYGAESTLNSAFLGRISRDYMVPAFQEGDYEGGILNGLSKIEERLLGSNDSDIQGSSVSMSKPQSDWWIWVVLILFLLIFFVMPVASVIIGIIYAIKNRGKYDDNYYNNAASKIFWGSGGLGGSSGGFGGGSGGGFSGGGGSFGGGGFSGKF
jgi:uncharacterized protein